MEFEILDKVVYKTVQYLIIDKDGTEYHVKCHEDDFLDYWSISSDDDDDIDPKSVIGSMLIEFCLNQEN